MDKKGEFYYDGCRDQLEAIEKAVDGAVNDFLSDNEFHGSDGLYVKVIAAIRAAAIGREGETK